MSPEQEFPRVDQRGAGHRFPRLSRTSRADPQSFPLVPGTVPPEGCGGLALSEPRARPSRPRRPGKRRLQGQLLAAKAQPPTWAESGRLHPHLEAQVRGAPGLGGGPSEGAGRRSASGGAGRGRGAESPLAPGPSPGSGRMFFPRQRAPVTSSLPREGRPRRPPGVRRGVTG